MTIDFQRVREQHSLTEVVSRYVVITKKGQRYWGLCPFHDDHNPDNFNVYRGADGIERFICFACHEQGDVVDFVAAIERCTKPEAIERITGEVLPRIGEYKPKPLPANQTSAWVPILPVPLEAPAYKPELTYIPDSGKLKNWSRSLDRMDAYRDSEGRLLCWVVRLIVADGKKICPTVTYCAGPGGEKKWCAKRMPAPYPLLGLDDLARYPTRHVMLVEGERCKAEHDEHCPQSKAGGPLYVAVSWLGGTGAVEQVDWSPLVGRKVDFFPDDDEAGRFAMKRIHEILIEKSGTGLAR